MDRSEIRSLDWRAAYKALGGAFEEVEALGERFRGADPAEVEAAEAQVEAAEESLSRLRAEAATLPAARARALDTSTAAEIRKIGDRIADIGIDIRIGEALVLAKRIALEELRVRAAGEVATPGRHASLLADDLLGALRDHLERLRGPISAAANQAQSAAYTAGELKRRRAALLAELEPAGVGQ